MSQTGAEKRVLEAMYNGALSPYGTGRMQMAGGTAYVAIPIELVDTLGLDRGQRFNAATTPKRIVS
jgi:hypothetical protein